MGMTGELVQAYVEEVDAKEERDDGWILGWMKIVR